MLTAMACCPLPTGRVGHGSAPWRVTDASEGPLLRCCEGAWGSQTRGATYPVACATILLVCLCAAHSVLPDPSCVLLLFAAALRQHHRRSEHITEASAKLLNELNGPRTPEIRCSRNALRRL